jgi:hypothetical protein
LRFPFSASAPELAPLVPHHLEPSDGRQVFFQTGALNRLESAQKVSIVRNERVPDSGRDLLDQIRVSCSFAEREPDLLDQVPVAFGMDLGPGLTIPGSAPIDQLLVGIQACSHLGRDHDRMNGRNWHRMAIAVPLPVPLPVAMAGTTAVSLASALAFAIAVAIVLAVQRLGDVRSNSSRAWQCDSAVWTE